MAKKMSPKELRAKAQVLFEQAKLEEDKLYVKVGRLVTKTLNKKDAFTSHDVAEIKADIKNLKEQVAKLLEGLR